MKAGKLFSSHKGLKKMKGTNAAPFIYKPGANYLFLLADFLAGFFAFLAAFFFVAIVKKF